MEWQWLNSLVIANCPLPITFLSDNWNLGLFFDDNINRLQYRKLGKMLPNNLREIVESTYKKAVDDGHIKFTESSSKKVKDPETGMTYQVTYAPSLQHKPEREPESEESKDKVKEDPFAKPEPELTVLDNCLDDYRLVLNKYPVTPNHLILVTKEYLLQTSPLSPKDLLATYKLLDQLDDEDEMLRHLAFYNCGPDSGSSQDHKHLQILPLPYKFVPFQDKICSGKEHFIPNAKTEPLQDSKVSFAHYVVPLPQDPSAVDEELLAMTFVLLLQRTLSSFQDWEGTRETAGKPVIPAYNVLMTKEWLCLVPRSKAFASEPSRIGFNATGYAGLVLVKWEESWDAVNKDPTLLNKLLLECAFPSTAGIKPTEYHY